MESKGFFQQGDIILYPVSKVSGKKQEKKAIGYVLSEGETVGHFHKIEDEIDLLISESGMFVSSKESFTLTHEEHGSITVPAGNYEVRHVQEYDHFAEEARPVID